jgi:hypothetical protein
MECARADEKQMSDLVFVTSEGEETAIEGLEAGDPFRDDLFKKEPDILKALLAVREDVLVPGRGVISGDSNEKALRRLAERDTRLVTVRVLAWATAVSMRRSTGHSSASQAIVLCRFRDRGGVEIGMLCQVCSSANVHVKWSVGRQPPVFLRPVHVGEWPIGEKAMVTFVSGTDFGVRNFMLEEGNVLLVTSYLPDYAQWNAELQKRLLPEERERMYRDYVRSIRSP